MKSGCPEKRKEKHRHPTSPEVAQCGIHTVITICFERSSHARLGGFGVTFGYLLRSLLVTLGSKSQFREQKNDLKKVIGKRSEKVTQEFSCGDWTALIGDSKQTHQTPKPQTPEPQDRRSTYYIATGQENHTWNKDALRARGHGGGYIYKYIYIYMAVRRLGVTFCHLLPGPAAWNLLPKKSGRRLPGRSSRLKVQCSTAARQKVARQKVPAEGQHPPPGRRSTPSPRQKVAEGLGQP